MTTEMVVLDEDRTMSDTNPSKSLSGPLKIIQVVRSSSLWKFPWLGWAFVYVVVLLFFFIYRCIALKALIMMYGSRMDCSLGVEAGALGLGLLEDFVCATYFACALWLFDTLKQVTSDWFGGQGGMRKNRGQTARICGGLTTFLVSWILFVAMMGPFVADLLIVQLRGMRFTFELVAMAIHEKDNASSASISQSEINKAYAHVAGLLVVATFFAIVRTWASCADLSHWNPAKVLLSLVLGRSSRTPSGEEGDTIKDTQDKGKKETEDVILELGETTGYSGTMSPDSASFSDATTGTCAASGGSRIGKRKIYQLAALIVFLVVALVVVPAIARAVSCACSPLVAYSALNSTLNEFFVRALGVTSQGFAPSVADGSIENADIYIHSATENYTLFQNDSLYRRTTGFQGELAFDVNVTEEDPPNVLLIVVESFRFHDSHYLVGDEDPSNLFKGTNITVTPNFDRWAKRGVAFNNMWSSWRTSRSVESLLFAQLPYDSVADSGMTGGKEKVELSGLPQLFTAKGYEPFFTTGCKTDYDDWDTFLPSHGFDTVWSRDEMMELAESTLNITSDQWYGDAHRGFDWGIHDDLSFQLLGDLLVNKSKEQSARVAQEEAKKPLFINHYTISSHTPFKERPTWYAKATKPDFSALYEGEEYADVVKAYLEMRYFTDMQLGKFLDRMSDAGILNDTIVVIVGDHGQGPECGLDVPEAREVSATHVAGTIIAEGRLVDSVGLMIEDAVEQYDILNTLADITGVPEGGFLQDGIGRSLKRHTVGERIVYSNNPSRKMSVVRGHERLRYDHYSSSVLLHNADTDHEMERDQFPILNITEKAKWRTRRDNGRRINAYYKKRWDKKCLLVADC